MALRADSYSSTSEIKTFVRPLLNGATTFNSTSLVSNAEVERIIDRVSAALNVALSGAGIATPISNSTAKLLCDEWTTEQAVKLVNLTQAGVGADNSENPQRMVRVSAAKFVEENRLGFANLGVSVAHAMSDGLIFTGMDAPAYRDDRSDSTITQPAFLRNLFNDPETTNYTDAIEDDE